MSLRDCYAELTYHNKNAPKKNQGGKKKFNPCQQHLHRNLYFLAIDLQTQVNSDPVTSKQIRM